MERIRTQGTLAAFGRSESGATAVEFAFVAPVLFLTLFSIVEIGTMAMMSSGLDNAVADTARRIRTGRDDGATSAATFEDQICARLGGNTTACKSRLTVSVQKFSRFTDANAIVTAPPAGQFDKGSAGDIVIVKANYVWPLMTPFIATAYQRSGAMQVTLGARAAFKNEPFE
jgi:Flp pilus assembly protein TadG